MKQKIRCKFQGAIIQRDSYSINKPLGLSMLFKFNERVLVL